MRFPDSILVTLVIVPGKLIGKNLCVLDDLQNAEIKQFRWNIQLFALR